MGQKMNKKYLEALNDEQFAKAAKAEPWAALVYAKDRLNDEQFAKAAKAKPQAALAYAKDRLNALRSKI